MKKLKNPISLIAIIVVLIVVLFFEYGWFSESTHSDLDISKGVMQVSFVDVGQGDCIFVKLPDGRIMLVDCGEYSERDSVKEFLDNNGVNRIDYLVATHPHTDHMGGMATVIRNYDIGAFYMPYKKADTNAFMYMLEALDEKNVKSDIVRAGDVIFETESFKCEVLSPVLDTYDETNDCSIVLKLICGKKSFLLTGDAEKYAEEQIDANVNADVLKVSHHGSTTSTSVDFLESVSPEYAVISCGKDNEYGHPHDEIISMLEAKDIIVYRTDIHGTITFLCDGKTVETIE